MKLIIDISDKTYEIIRDMMYFYNSQRSGRAETKEIITAIKQGTPLPKGHGDLIDRDEFHQTLENIPIRDNDKWFNWLQKACLRLAEAPTIIEADKGE